MSWSGRWWRWLQADLARPEAPVAPGERTFLTLSAAGVVALAQVADPGTWAQLVVLGVALTAMVLRAVVTAMPAELFAGLVLVPVALVVGVDGQLEPAFFLVVTMVVYVSWHLGSVARAVLVTATAAALPWLVATRLAPGSGIGWEAWSVASVLMFAVGRALRRQQALILELEAARLALADQAVADERRRIARELHDLAGHTLAAVLLHVTGARHVLRRDPEEAERALRDAEAVGRESLDQIRATVAALRTSERGTDPALPGGADLAALVEEYRRAGLAVDAHVDPAAARLDGPVGVALARITREALANVARHAPANRVTLTVEVDDHAGGGGSDGGDRQGDHHGGEGDRDPIVELVVADRGRPAAPPAPDGGHFGLVGMRERARALGGELEAAPTPDGWRVAARLPLAASSHHRSPAALDRSPGGR